MNIFPYMVILEITYDSNMEVMTCNAIAFVLHANLFVQLIYSLHKVSLPIFPFFGEFFIVAT